MRTRVATVILTLVSLVATAAGAAEIAPARFVAGAPAAIGHYSEGTIVAAVSVDRDGASLIAYTRKARPFERAVAEEFRLPGEREALEVALLGPGDARYTRRIPIEGVCFEHAADTPPHVEGATIRLHRESYIVELPELAGFDRLEIVRTAATDPAASAGALLGVVALSPDKFTPAGGPARYEDLAFASVSAATPAPAPAEAGKEA